MSQFEGFNAENKLRIPLSAYAAQIIDTDCMNFSKKKATLINTVILNYYQKADCSISLRLIDYKEELSQSFSATELKRNEEIINKLLLRKAKVLKEKYAHRHPADVNWQITLNKKVKELLTSDQYSCEEKYYGERPGHFIRSLLEEYARLPYYLREEIVYKQIIDTITTAIDGQYALTLKNTKGIRLALKPYEISTDPLSMYHYLIGYCITPEDPLSDNSKYKPVNVMSIRLSRLVDVELQHHQSGTITISEKNQILRELDEKGVQFVSGELTQIKVWLSDFGIKKYNSQLHLRPIGIRDTTDDHLFYFECTEAQVLYYFIGFGKEAKILSPDNLANRFKNIYTEALNIY